MDRFRRTKKGIVDAASEQQLEDALSGFIGALDPDEVALLSAELGRPVTAEAGDIPLIAYKLTRRELAYGSDAPEKELLSDAVHVYIVASNRLMQLRRGGA